MIEFTHSHISLSQRSSPWSQSRNPFGNKLKKKKDPKRKKPPEVAPISSIDILGKSKDKIKRKQKKGNRKTRHIVGEDMCGKRA